MTRLIDGVLTLLLVVATVSNAKAASVPMPIIERIVSATFKQHLAEGGIVTLFGSSLSAAPYIANSLPLPTRLGVTEVLLCGTVRDPTPCSPLGLTYVGPGQINFVLPQVMSNVVQNGGMTSSGWILQIVGGSAWNFAVRVNGQLDQAAQNGTYFSSVVYQQAPTIFVMGSDCPIDPTLLGHDANCGLQVFSPYDDFRVPRGSIIDQSGRLIDSSNPAHPGQYYSVYLTGLGRIYDTGRFLDFPPAIPPDIPAGPGVTLNRIPVKNGAPDASFPLRSVFAGLSGYPGLDQINFLLPSNLGPRFPCSVTRFEGIIGVRPPDQDPDLWFPIIVDPGSVPCVP